MDEVGPQVVPSVEVIRERFTARREQVGAWDQVVRRALGMDAKMRQYSDGAAFVRHVVDRIGMAGFNTVWTAPDRLPTRAEIHDPDQWIARVVA
jgi:putative hydrolase